MSKALVSNHESGTIAIIGPSERDKRWEACWKKVDECQRLALVGAKLKRRGIITEFVCLRRRGDHYCGREPGLRIIQINHDAITRIPVMAARNGKSRQSGRGMRV